MAETRTIAMLWGVTLAVVAACGGGSSTTGVTTGLPADEKLSALSDDEVRQACQSLNDSAALVVSRADLQRVACLPYGVQASATQANGQVSVNVSQCQQVVDACVNDASSQNGPVSAGAENNEQDCSSASAADVMGCDATVGEYEACFNLLLDELRRRLSAMTCQNAAALTSQDYNADFDPASIPQCAAIMDMCPDAQLGIPGAE